MLVRSSCAGRAYRVCSCIFSLEILKHGGYHHVSDWGSYSTQQGEHWLLGLVALFSLRVREVPGSIPGAAHLGQAVGLASQVIRSHLTYVT